jgi:solute carrier family 50 protein (sugar transporter)|uniref:Sugar transporter SWEET n=1 Tax=Panagrolaimus sp. PS1159 TaxID=55785 RepID=A0AC35G5G2_9BILA
MDTFIDVLSVTATLSTIGLFLCGFSICRRIRQRGTTDGTSIAPFFLTCIGCACMFGYGWTRKDMTVKFVNGVGFSFQVVYLFYYYIHTRVKRKVNKFIAAIIVIICATVWYVNSDRALEEKQNVLGTICMVLNIAAIGSPLADIGQVIRNKSTESLPFALCVANMIVSVQWLLYGILVDDFYIKMPNIVAVIISTAQLSLFIIFPAPTYANLVNKNDNEIL